MELAIKAGLWLLSLLVNKSKVSKEKRELFDKFYTEYFEKSSAVLQLKKQADKQLDDLKKRV